MARQACAVPSAQLTLRKGVVGPVVVADALGGKDGKFSGGGSAASSLGSSSSMSLSEPSRDTHGEEDSMWTSSTGGLNGVAGRRWGCGSGELGVRGCLPRVGLSASGGRPGGRSGPSTGTAGAIADIRRARGKRSVDQGVGECAGKAENWTGVYRDGGGTRSRSVAPEPA